MGWKEIQKERNEQCEERHALAVDRLRGIVSEETVSERYLPFFQDTAIFLLELENIRRKISDGTWDLCTLEEMQSLNEILYRDILPQNYGNSYADPACAVKKLGEDKGGMLCFLYAEMRSGIPYVSEGRTDYLTILCELFIEVYNCFEENAEPDAKEIRDIIYWYASDYCDVFLADRIEEQIDPEYSFAADIIENADLEDDKYLYRFGEYITENELGTARHLRKIGRAHV